MRKHIYPAAGTLWWAFCLWTFYIGGDVHISWVMYVLMISNILALAMIGHDLDISKREDKL